MAQKNKIIAQGAAAPKNRRDFMTHTTIAFGAVGAACAAYPFVRSMNPSADVKALKTVDVDLSDLSPGESKIILWQGKPVYIQHRTPAQIAAARADDKAADLIDPEEDATRTIKKEWMVFIKSCTHLGCLPNKGGNHADGWLCPCHGSQFDSSGRVRRGPAPTNLAVPPYVFLNDTTIRIG